MKYAEQLRQQIDLYHSVQRRATTRTGGRSFPLSGARNRERFFARRSCFLPTLGAVRPRKSLVMAARNRPGPVLAVAHAARLRAHG